MNAIQKTQMVTQVIGAVGLLFTMSLYYLQLRTMGKQLAAMQRGADAQQILSLLNFIESEEVRVAREVVYTVLHRKHLSEWTKSELEAASRVCASFATTGRVLRTGIVPIEPVLEGWEPALRRCYQILEPFLREKQKPENGGPQYWAGFDWLHSQLDRPKAVGRKAQKLRRGIRGSDAQAKSKHQIAEVNNVG
jgi:hypothetical protein